MTNYKFYVALLQIKKPPSRSLVDVLRIDRTPLRFTHGQCESRRRRRRTEIREEGKGKGGGESSYASNTRPLYRSCVRACVCVCVRVKNFVSVKRKEGKKSLLLLRFRCKIFRVSHPAKNPSATR